jgi:phenylacetate-CoA ligase
MIEFKISDFFYAGDLAKTYWLMRRSEHWQTGQFKRYQAEHLLRLLVHCCRNVPFYMQSFEKLGLTPAGLNAENVFDWFHQLPLLDKDMLRINPDQFMASNAKNFSPKPITTSGTTGTPLTVYWDRGSNVMELCSMQRFWRWAGFRIGQPFLDLRSRLFTSLDRHLVQKGQTVYIRNWKANALEFSSDLIDERNLAEYYKLLLHHHPRLVRGHPQAIQKLAMLLQEQKLTGWKPHVVTPTSETLYDFQKNEIERAWGAPVLDHYGLKEHNAFFAQCLQGGYHIFPEYGITEIVDDNGLPAPAGQEGWIVATGLHNFVQPLLRYNTRDRGIAAIEETCACGRTLPLIQSVIGRIDDCIYTGSGKRYSGMHFAFFGRKGIQKARLVQENLQSVNVELVASPDFNESERTQLMDILLRKVDHQLVFHFVYKEDIVQEKPGKYKFVVCHCRPGFSS